jgi:hypothetical protein
VPKQQKSPSAELGLKEQQEGDAQVETRAAKAIPKQGRRQQFVFTTWEKQLERVGSS